MKTNLDYLCEELDDTAVRWTRQAERMRKEAAAFRSRRDSDTSQLLGSWHEGAAEVCEAHADTLRKLIRDYSDVEVTDA